MGQNLASEQNKGRGCEKLIEITGCKWEEENSQRLQLGGNPVSLFLSSSWQSMNHQIYEKVEKDPLEACDNL